MYLRKDGREMEAVNPTESALVARENAMNFPLTATITVSKKEWEEMILVNDRLNRAVGRITLYLADEAKRGETFSNIKTLMRMLDMNPNDYYKKMP